MALVKCKTCGHPVDSWAEKCPGCGRSILTDNPWVWVCVPILFVGIYLLARYLGVMQMIEQILQNAARPPA